MLPAISAPHSADLEQGPFGEQSNNSCVNLTQRRIGEFETRL